MRLKLAKKHTFLSTLPAGETGMQLKPHPIPHVQLKLVKTSTLCMTQVIFPTIVYIQIISLKMHCITIPVGQKFTYMALEGSDRLFDII